jgi:hypothetical protein
MGDNGNPFDQPLNSEVQESQQRQVATQQASPNGNPFDEPLASEVAEKNAKVNLEDQASKNRQMMVSGMTGMPTPNMTDADKASFERGKAAGAISVPVVAGATLAATAAPEVVPTIVQKAKAVAEWAKTNPLRAYAISKMADELGIHPFDLMHSAVKYGKNLFGDSEEGK